ncbi:MerR family transcriptional regulator [Gracilibacillus phocaeensis]|uniref:MerR family transcriptional regulator n=1 Tax=Gracilibacillus phocaeensis TaxID=2042304 RepID=UPI0010313A1C|nr:MerR family transcriptional regulator [Gracilibacillus phocaeensis]
MDSEAFTVSEFAAYTGVSVRTLHYYEEKELMQPKRNQAGHRIYDKNDAMRLHQIMTMKFLGLPLAAIKKYLQSDALDLGFKDTLLLQQAKLREDKAQIETALETIQRTVHLMDQEEEIDSDLLFSLVSGIQSEKKQEEMTKPMMKEEIWSRLFGLTIMEKMEYEQKLLQFLKALKRLTGRPPEDPEVTAVVEDYFDYLLGLLKLDRIQDVEGIFKMDIHHEENEEQILQFLQEMERLSYIPFNKKEEAWLGEVFDHFYQSSADQS